MPSFFLSETLKYLYLTFDFDNPFRQNRRNYVLTTEAHIFPLHLRGAHPQEAMRDLSLKQRAKTAPSVLKLACAEFKMPQDTLVGETHALPYLSHVGPTRLLYSARVEAPVWPGPSARKLA